MTAVWAEFIGDFMALAIALIGWGLHIRQCKATTDALRQENAKLIETLAHLAERKENHSADQWRRAP